VRGSRKSDLAAPGSTRGGDGAAAVPGGLLAAVELLVDDGRCTRRPSAAAHGATWPNPAVEVVCTRRSGSVAVPGSLSAAVQRLGGVAVAASRGQPWRPSGLSCSSFPLLAPTVVVMWRTRRLLVDGGVEWWSAEGRPGRHEASAAPASPFPSSSDGDDSKVTAIREATVARRTAEREGQPRRLIGLGCSPFPPPPRGARV
jgi:hypothetical protein